MSSRNLLRSIFRRHRAPPATPSPQKPATTPKNTTNLRYAISADELKTPSARFESETDSESPCPRQKWTPSPSPARSGAAATLRTQSSMVLDSITEDEGSESDASSVSGSCMLDSSPARHVSAAMTLREVLHSAVGETRAAIVAHLDTIELMLDLLGALEHFSPTVEQIRVEMLWKREVCLGRLGELGSGVEGC